MGFISKRKLVLIIAGAILILFIGIAIGSGSKNNQPDSSQIKSQNQPQAEPQTSSITNISVQNKNNTGLVKVMRVIDGDTIEIDNGERIRYIGIDTPETVDPRTPVQCFGVEAFNKNKELVESKEIRLEKDITDRDKYNRLLRYVWVGDTFINLELVKQGFAYSYSYPPDIKYQDQFVKAQQEARESKRGLWSACPATTQEEQPAPPPAEQKEGASNDCVIKGNISSSGEKIYHLPGCGSYTKTKIDEARGEKWFCTEAEVLAAGWRKALNCP